MIGIQIQTNAVELMDKFDTKAERIARFIQEALTKASLLVERGAKIKSPVDTGRMRASIQSNVRPLVATIFPTVKYAIFVHDGTRFMAGRPFLKDALDESNNQITDLFKKAVHSAIQ